jgi:hypothetical protein
MVWFFLNQNPASQPSTDSTTEVSTDPSIPPSLTEKEAVTSELPANEEGLITPPTLALPDATHLPAATGKITAFYQTLDRQPYFQAKNLNTPSAAYCTKLLHKALSNPPVAVRETDDLLTLLKNSAHFFRIFGKENILLIKEILTNEQASIEEFLANTFLLLKHPDTLSGELALNLPAETIDEAIYTYACFFLNTLGGRSYLLRRDVRTRILASYYAIMIVEQANEKSKNQHGLQLQPTIDLLTAEIETSGTLLHYKDAYLDQLYDLKEKYQ